MFDSLVESGSHKDDLARKGSFFLGTFAIYGVILIALIILSIVTYNSNLDAQNLELTTLVAPVPVQQQPDPAPKDEPKPAQATPDREVPTRTEFVASTNDPTKVPDKPSVVASKVPPVPPGGAVLGKTNRDPVGGPAGPVGPSTGGGGIGAGTGPVRVVDTDDEPPPPPKPTPVKPRAPISGGVLNGKAISKPAPPYPPIAKTARQSGIVVVQITVDEGGKVIAASAVSGPPLLRQAAVQAAYQARFSPTMLSGQPVKVTGTISYSFNLQ